MQIERKFGSIEPLDRIKMHGWLNEPGVVAVEVLDTSEGAFMQRVGKFPATLIGVKKRFQKAPKAQPKSNVREIIRIIKDASKDNTNTENNV